MRCKDCFEAAICVELFGHGASRETVNRSRAGGRPVSLPSGKSVPSGSDLTGAAFRLDETYVKVGAEWKCLYRAVDSAGSTIEFMLSAKRDVLEAR